MGIPVAALLLTSCVPFNKSQFCFLVYKGDGQYLTKGQQLRVFNKKESGERLSPAKCHTSPGGMTICNTSAKMVLFNKP